LKRSDSSHSTKFSQFTKECSSASAAPRAFEISGYWKAPSTARTGYYRDLVEMAAALCESLLQNHPFIDGNKRVAFFGTDVFLRLNGWKLEVEPITAHAELIGLLADGLADFEHLLTWLRDRLLRL